MITVTLKYYGLFAQLAGKQSEQIQFKGKGTVAELLEQLSRKYGAELADRAEAERVYKSALVVRGDARIDKDTPLNQGDEIALLFPVGGG
jgi:MoaD family protein